MDQIVSPPGRRERKKQETAARLKASALEIFARDGFSNAKIKDVAERADVAERTLFNYVADKRDLLAFIFADDYLDLAQHAFTPADRDRPLLDQLGKEFTRSVYFFRRFGQVSLILFREGIWYDTSPHLVHLKAGRATLGSNLLAMLETKQRMGELSIRASCADLASIFIAIFIANLQRSLAETEEEAARTVASVERQFELVLRGVINNPAA